MQITAAVLPSFCKTYLSLRLGGFRPFSFHSSAIFNSPLLSSAAFALSRVLFFLVCLCCHFSCFFFLFFFFLLFFISRLLPLSCQFMPGEYHQVHLLINSNACLPETLGCNCMSPHKAASIQDVLSSNVSHPMNHKLSAFSWRRH